MAASNTVVVGLEDFLSSQFDYLILGGGTAGLAVAGRLAEDPNICVGVIEAGKDRRNDPLVDMPLGMTQMRENEKYDWAHRTAPQVRLGRTQPVTRSNTLVYRSTIRDEDIMWFAGGCWVAHLH